MRGRRAAHSHDFPDGTFCGSDFSKPLSVAPIFYSGSTEGFIFNFCCPFGGGTEINMAGSLTDTHRLSNGVEIPILGFGTWQTPDGDTARDCVKAALDAG